MAGKKIGLVLALDGEKEFTQALQNANKEANLFKTELKNLSKEFDGNANSMDALRAKQEALTKLQDSYQRKLDSAKTGLRNATEKYNEQANALSKLRKDLEDAKDAQKKMEDAGDKTSDAYKKQCEKVKELSDAVNKQSVNTLQASGRVTDWNKRVSESEGQLRDTNRALEQNGKYLKEAEQATDKCAKSIDEFGNETEDTSKSIDVLAQTLAAAGVAKSIKEITEALYECSEASTEFETGVAKVGTIADKTVVPLEGMKNQIMNLSGDIGKNVNTLSEATYQAISASVDTADAVGFVKDASKLATGGFTDETTAVDILTTALNAYNLKADQTTRISDVLITTQNLGKTSVANLGSSMGKVIPLAAAYNVQIEDLSTGYALLTANGIKTEETTTYLKAALNELGKEGSKVSDALKEKTGKSFTELMKSGMSLGDVVKILGDSVNGDATAFNNLWSSTEAGIGMLSILNSGTEKYNEVLNKMQNSAGATEAAFKEMSNTSEYAQARMENALNNLKIAIGDELNPALNQMRNAGSDAFEWATEFVQQNPWIVGAINGLIAALGALTIGLTALKIIPVVTKMFVAFNAALSANPAILVATAIVGLVTAIATIAPAIEKSTSEENKNAKAVRECKDSYEELTAEIRRSKEERDNSRGSIESEYGACQILSDKLYNLSEKVEKTTADKAQMSAIVDELNSKIPNLNLQIDETTGALNRQKTETDSLIDSMKNQALAAAAQEDMAQVAKDLYEIEKQRASAQEVYNNLREAATNAEEEYNKALKDQTISTESAYEAYSVKISEINEQIDSQKKILHGLNDAYNEQSESFHSVSDAAAGYVEKASGMTDANNDIAESAVEMSKEVAEAYAEMQESIASSIESSASMFDEFSGGTEISKEEILKNLESSKDGIKEWGKNMQILAGRAGEGMTKELYDYLADMGPESANLVQAFVNMSEEELRKAANDFKQVDMKLPEYYSEQIANASYAWKAGGEELSQAVHSAANKVKNAAAEGAEGTGQEMAESIESGKQQVTDSVKGVMDESSDVVKESYTDFRQSAQDSSNGIGDGIDANRSDAMAATSSVMSHAVETAKGYYSEFHSAGRYLSSGTASGIAAGSPEVEDAVRRVVRNGINAGTKEAEVNSPSKVSKREIGAPISEGVAKGIESKTKEVEKSSAGMVGATLNSAKKELESHADEFKNAVGKQISGSVTLGIKQGTGKAKKTVKEYAKAVFEEAEKQLENFRASNVSVMNVSIDDMEWYWDRLLKKSKKKGKKYYSEMKKLIRAEKKELEQQRKSERLDAQETALDSYKTYYDVSPKAEMQYWDVMRKKYREGTDQRIEADKKYFEAKDNYYEKLEDLEDEYYEKCQEVKDKLQEDIDALQESYNQAFDERKSAIKDAFGIFDEFSSESESPEKLLANMQSQVQGYALWMEQMSELEGKNILSSDFLSDLQNMGPDAAATIVSLNMMTEEQLRLANEAYEEKNRLAEAQAAKETEALRKETEDKISAATKEAQAELDAYKQEYQSAVNEINVGISDSLKKLSKDSYNSGVDAVANLIKGIKDKTAAKDTDKQMKGIQKEIADGLDGLPAKGKAIGKDTLAGILKGLSNSLEIKKGAKSFVDELEDAIRKEADMHSPSKRFEKLSIDIPAGSANGIKKGTPMAVTASTDMVKAMLEESKKKISQQQEALQQYLSGIHAGSGIAALNNLAAQAVTQTNVTVNNTGATDMMSGIVAEIRGLKEAIWSMGIYIDEDNLVGCISEKMGNELAGAARKVR